MAHFISLLAFYFWTAESVIEQTHKLMSEVISILASLGCQERQQEILLAFRLEPTIVYFSAQYTNIFSFKRFQ